MSSYIFLCKRDLKVNEKLFVYNEILYLLLFEQTFIASKYEKSNNLLSNK